MTALVVFYDARMLEHDPGPAHVERKERLEAARRGLLALGDAVVWRYPRTVTREELERVHDPAYLDRLEAIRGQTVELDSDTATSPGTLMAAGLAAGAAVHAVEVVVEGPIHQAWALVRPPGHHAERDRAMGFCLYNNAAVAAAHALHLGVPRVFVLDWDVHHGNGTQHLFEERADVLFASVHRGYGFYPGTGRNEDKGRGEGHGLTLNVELPAGAGDDLFLAAIDQVLDQAAAFGPSLVVVSAGFDAHERDPLGGLAVTDRGYAEAMRRVKAFASRQASGRLVCLLEGGYDLIALEGAVRATGEVLCSP